MSPLILMSLSLLVACQEDDNPMGSTTQLSDQSEVESHINNNLILPPGSFTMSESDLETTDEVEVVSADPGTMGIVPGQTVTNNITFTGNQPVMAVGMRFGTSGNINFVSINATNATNGTGSFQFQVSADICDMLAQICHDIRCYEFALTEDGMKVTRANLVDIVMACGSAPSSCSGLLQGQDGSPRFNLTWSGSSDLDLHVTDPTGSRIYFGNKTSSSGGMLDVDCRGNCSGGNSENITWTNGGPSGTYQVRVDYFSGSVAVNYTLTIRDGGITVRTENGILSSSGDEDTYTYNKP